MTQERISVIVPAYNIADRLPGCLDSLLAQTHEALEVIVVNDGSTDGTGAVADAYAAGDRRIRVIHKENGGVTSARLRGVEAALGDWIGFADGDDEIEPDMYARLLRNACAHGADITHCGHRVIFPDGRIEYVHNTGVLRIQDRKTGLQDLMDGGLIDASLCTKLYRRKLADGLREKMDLSVKNNEDYLMNYHLFMGANISVFEDFCPYHYILRRGSASYRKLTEHMLFDPIRVRESILEMAPEELRTDARIALMRNCLFAYAQLTVDRDPEYNGFRKRVRGLIAEQRPWFRLLSLRNRILAHMICIAPWSFRLAYGLYVKLFQREEQH